MGYAVHGLLSEVEHSVLQTHLSRCSFTSSFQCPLLFLTSPGIPGEQELRQYGRVDSLGQWASESQGLSEIAIPSQFLRLYPNLDELSSCENRKAM